MSHKERVQALLEESGPAGTTSHEERAQRHRAGSFERSSSSGSHRQRPSLRVTWQRAPSTNGGSPGFSSAPKLGVAAIIAMVFFNVSGGPWGSEDIFSKSDPLIGMCGIALFTVGFCVPQILMTSELSCALPSNGGYAIWVREAFGDFWCFQVTYWRFVSGVADAAVYPVLVCDTAWQLFDVRGLSAADKSFWRILTAVLLSLPTTISSSSIPAFLLAFAVSTGIPVFVFVCVGLRTLSMSVLSEHPAGGGIQLGKFVHVLFWNLEGWDCISTCVSLCAEPREETIPRGLFIASAATSLQYMLVLLAATAIGVGTYPWQDWTDGALPSIGRAAGPSMSMSLLVASLTGNAGQFLSAFIENSYLLQGAAEVDVVPRLLGKQLPKSGVPYMANAVQLLVIILLMSFDFHDILVFDNFFCANGVAVEFAAFFALRWRRPDLQRPFRTPRVWLPLFVPAALVILLVWSQSMSGKAALINVCASAVGVPYGVWVASRSKREHREGHAKSGFDQWIDDDG